MVRSESFEGPSRLPLALLVGLILLAGAGVAFRGAIAEVAALYPLASGAHPYFAPQSGLLLYGAGPVVVIGAMVLFMAPGLVGAMALRRTSTVSEAIGYGFPISLISISAGTLAVQAATGVSPDGLQFSGIIVVLTAIALAWLRWNPSRAARTWPLSERVEVHALAASLVFPLVIVAVLTPKLFWESFNGDGAHIYEGGRLLTHQLAPFFDEQAGVLARYPDFKSALYVFPTSWFIRMFGEVEAAVRLPAILFLIVIANQLLNLAAFGREAARSIGRVYLVWVGLAVTLLVFAYNDAVYSGDLGLPGEDLMVMGLFLGFVLTFLKRQPVWMAAFIIAGYLTSPHMPIMVGLWCLAAFICLRPLPIAATVVALGVLGSMVMADLGSARLAGHIGVAAPGGEHGVSSLAQRLSDTQFGQMRRLGWLVVPGGILPALSLLTLPRQDRITRALTLTAVANFAFFFFQRQVSLHYFIPSIILSLAVFWRQDHLWAGRLRPFGGAAIIACGLAAAVLSWPSSLRVNNGPRTIGYAVDNRMPGYEVHDPIAIRQSQLLSLLFAKPNDDGVPFQRYGGAAVTWNYYAHHAPAQRHIAYVIAPIADAAPAGGRLVASRDGASLYVVDEALYARHRTMKAAVSSRNWLYRVPK